MKWVLIGFVCGVVKALIWAKGFVGSVDMVEERCYSDRDEWQWRQ